MASVEHCKADYHLVKKASVAQPQKESSSNETAIGLGEAEKGRDKAPADEKKRQIIPSPKVLEDPTGRNINGYVRNVKWTNATLKLFPSI
jgi:hypothetical protein